MSPSGPLSQETWRKVNEVFHRALDVAEDQQAAFVDEACERDPRVKAEVLSLLAAHKHTHTFIERPAGSADDLLSLALDESERLVGHVVGQYRIARILGEGGMGVVYLAEDLRLGRTVTLKALASRFTGDPSRRERLRREARAAAALTHPGIATVYALEEIDGHMFIAGEYVPGETLRDEVGRGPLGLPRTVDTALGIARALAVAHDRGVVHRDLKPENVIRTPAGDVKILDFGLARMREASVDAARLTDDGTLLGTPAYMSPEQIRGEAVDLRSDLFSFGILIYELVSGVHPFAGSDPASTIARILESEPVRLGEHPMAGATDPTMLGELDGVVHICLRKAPDARFRSAHELVNALELIRQGLPVPQVHGRPGEAGPSQTTPLWWWMFHQAAASVAYCLLLVPLWMARGWISGRIGLTLFLAGLVAVTVATILRLHLWFTVRSYPSEWARQRAHSGAWIRLADILLVAVLLVAGVGVENSHASVAAVLIGAAVAVLVSSAIIEPATTRAAFGDSDSAK